MRALSCVLALAALSAPAWAEEPVDKQALAPEVREPSDVQAQQIVDPKRDARRPDRVVRDLDDPFSMVPHPVMVRPKKSAR